MGSAPYLGGGFGHFYAYAPYKMQYPIDRFTMEIKRQLDINRIERWQSVSSCAVTNTPLPISPTILGTGSWSSTTYTAPKSLLKLRPIPMWCDGRIKSKRALR